MVDKRAFVVAGAVVVGAIGVVGLLLDSAWSEEPERPATPPLIEDRPGAPETEPRTAAKAEGPADHPATAGLPALLRPALPDPEGAAGGDEAKAEAAPAPGAPGVGDGGAGHDANATAQDANATAQDANATAPPTPSGEAPRAGEVAAKAGGPAGTWETSLSMREQALAKTQEAILSQLKRLEEIQAAVETRWREADELQKLAASRWTAATLTTPEGVIHLPASGDEREAQLALVATIVKKMKPSEAASLMARWDDPLAVDIVARLSPRSSSPILAKMPPELAARLTRILARTGAPTPLRGRDK